MLLPTLHLVEPRFQLRHFLSNIDRRLHIILKKSFQDTSHRLRSVDAVLLGIGVELLFQMLFQSEYMMGVLVR